MAVSVHGGEDDFIHKLDFLPRAEDVDLRSVDGLTDLMVDALTWPATSDDGEGICPMASEICILATDMSWPADQQMVESRTQGRPGCERQKAIWLKGVQRQLTTTEMAWLKAHLVTAHV